MTFSPTRSLSFALENRIINPYLFFDLSFSLNYDWEWDEWEIHYHSFLLKGNSRILFNSQLNPKGIPEY